MNHWHQRLILAKFICNIGNNNELSLIYNKLINDKVEIIKTCLLNHFK